MPLNYTIGEGFKGCVGTEFISEFSGKLITLRDPAVGLDPASSRTVPAPDFQSGERVFKTRENASSSNDRGFSPGEITPRYAISHGAHF